MACEGGIEMVIKQFFTPNGVITRELTPEEMAGAFKDDVEVKREVVKLKLKTAITDTEKLNAILEYLGLKDKDNIPLKPVMRIG